MFFQQDVGRKCLIVLPGFTLGHLTHVKKCIFKIIWRKITFSMQGDINLPVFSYDHWTTEKNAIAIYMSTRLLGIHVHLLVSYFSNVSKVG